MAERLQDEFEDIKLCYSVIFTTQKGTVVLNPNLGWNIRKYLSKPIDTVMIPMKTDLLTELNIQEPRVTAYDVVFDEKQFSRGILKANIKCVYNGNAEVVSVG